MTLKIEDIARAIGRDVYDEYGRVIGILVSISSDTEGVIEYAEVKIVDRGLEKIEGDRIKLVDGKVTVTPQWKYEAIKLIESLDRAYKRKKGVEDMAARGDLPSEVLEELNRRLTDQIKKLKIKAREVETAIKSRINEIDNESLHVARAMAILQMTYFSGEVGEREFEQGMNHLRKLRDTLASEKKDAKEVLDKLSKTLELASGQKIEAAKKAPAKHEAKTPGIESGTLAVKIVEA